MKLRAMSFWKSWSFVIMIWILSGCIGVIVAFFRDRSR